MSDSLTVVPAWQKPGWTIYRDEHHFVAHVADKDDAQLFAAAPQLLEACERARTAVLDCIRDHAKPGDLSLVPALAKIEAAIRAAREG